MDHHEPFSGLFSRSHKCSVSLRLRIQRFTVQGSFINYSYEKHSCASTLVVKRLEVNTELFQDHKFIKDPEKTFLFLNDQETIPKPRVHPNFYRLKECKFQEIRSTKSH